jgi:hypothetical protein
MFSGKNSFLFRTGYSVNLAAPIFLLKESGVSTGSTTDVKDLTALRRYQFEDL